MNKSRGFTIIELIIVIAIIAVLAAIVLVNVTQYIGKSKDAAIEGNMASLMTSAAAYYDIPPNTYTGFCAANFVSGKPIFDQDPSTSKVCNESATAWAACSQLIATPGDYWCVDSNGTKKQVTGTCTDAVGSEWALTACPS